MYYGKQLVSEEREKKKKRMERDSTVIFFLNKQVRDADRPVYRTH